MNNPVKENSRRDFLGKVVAGTAAGLTTLSAPLISRASIVTGTSGEADAWFKKAKGAHRIVYDAPEPHNGWAFIWSWVFYVTSNNSGTPDSDMTAMVVLRHNAIPFALKDSLWEKYKLGEMFGVTDNTTKAPALRNPYYDPREGDFPFPGIDGMKRLQERGAMFCICDMALTVYSQVAAQPRGLNPEEVKKDWVSGLQPGVQVVPSGVWAIGRAQEHGFAYCYAGG
ncbi:MAG TPA: twin-arginine translocation signal domain-containing protein [Cyclobacteriaceae bacterium]|nr:twin-arginine translocation signal domain-containing protein [Cyclobacteriaceae bacterium]